jgi:hypothetical protein
MPTARRLTRQRDRSVEAEPSAGQLAVIGGGVAGSGLVLRAHLLDPAGRFSGAAAGHGRLLGVNLPARRPASRQRIEAREADSPRPASAPNKSAAGSADARISPRPVARDAASYERR